jgi:hypothetical protein
MNPNSKNPAAREAGRAPNSFCLAAERSEHTQASAKTQGNETVSDVRAALLRDFVFEALAPLESDAAAARLSLKKMTTPGPATTSNGLSNALRLRPLRSATLRR